MSQRAPWSKWFKNEAKRLVHSFRVQLNLWQMWRLPIHSEEFKARFRDHLALNRRVPTVKPWEDPRRSPEDQAAWIQAEPKGLRRAG